MNKARLITILILTLFSVLAIASVANALPLTINRVEVNDKELEDGSVRIYERADELDISVDIDCRDVKFI